MRLQALRLQNVRRFVEPVAVTGIAPGLNVLAAANEQGKSTLLDALHALFFTRHRAWDQHVRALQPHAGGDPQVQAEIALDGACWTVAKTWRKSRNGSATVHRDGILRHQADEAEAWIAERVRPPKDGGPAGLVWVRQGVLGLGEGRPDMLARRSVMASVAGEVAAMTGGRRMDRTVDAVGAALARYLTDTGRVKTGGPLAEAEKAVEERCATREALSRQAAALRDELEARARLRRERARLDDPEEAAARQTRLTEAEAAEAKARAHAAEAERAGAKRRAAALEAAEARRRHDALAAAIAERQTAAAALVPLTAAATEATATHRAAEAALSAAKLAEETAAAAARDASDMLRRALDAQMAAQTAERRTELTARLEEARQARSRLEAARAAMAAEIGDKAMAALTQLHDRLQRAHALRDSTAAAVSIAYLPGAEGRVARDGAPLAAEERLALPDGGVLDLEGIGRLTIHPAQNAGQDDVAAAHRALTEALAEAGQADMAGAMASAAQHGEARSVAEAARARLDIAAPDEIEALEAAIARLPAPGPSDGPAPPPRVEAETAETAARQAAAAATASLERARGLEAEARRKLAEAGAARQAAAARLEQADRALAGHQDPATALTDLAAARDEAAAMLAEAERVEAALSADAPDLDAASARLARARATIEAARSDRERIERDLVRLNTQIDIHAANAVDERLAECEERLAAATARRDALRFEVAVLQRLQRALGEARAAARERYVAPVMDELRPLLRRLMPGAEIALDAEAMLPATLTRPTGEERFEQLSGGTQEQIALLVRLAFARLMAKGGSAPPLILDDALVFTDDDRIERLFDTLTAEAADLQIIVLTCRSRAFRALGGTRLSIAPAPD